MELRKSTEDTKIVGTVVARTSFKTTGFVYCYRVPLYVTADNGMRLCVLKVGQAGQPKNKNKTLTRDEKWQATLVRVDAERNAWHNLTGVSPDIPAKRARTKLLADLEEQEIPSFSEENRKFSDWAFVLYRDSKDHEADLDDTESFVRQLLGLPFPRALIQEIITRHPSENCFATSVRCLADDEAAATSSGDDLNMTQQMENPDELIERPESEEEEEEEGSLGSKDSEEEEDGDDDTDDSLVEQTENLHV